MNKSFEGLLFKKIKPQKEQLNAEISTSKMGNEHKIFMRLNPVNNEVNFQLFRRQDFGSFYQRGRGRS